MTTENYDALRNIAVTDVKILEQKGKTYGSSWRKRGGVGAFMMLARKWDRIENQMEAAGYDIFEPLQKEMSAATTDGLLDDIRDLRRYLLLVEGHIASGLSHTHEMKVHGSVTGRVPICGRCGSAEHHASDCDYVEGEPVPGYVCQDPDLKTSPVRPRQA